MSKHDLVIVEIIYKDPVSRTLEPVIGKISQFEIDNFNENQSNFIIPQEI